MSDNVWIGLIAAVCIVIVMYIIRDRLKEFGLVVAPHSFKASMKVRDAKAAEIELPLPERPFRISQMPFVATSRPL